MTLIIGFKTDQGVIMGCDSAITNSGIGSLSERVAEPKIWKVNIGRAQPMLLATRGSVRFGNILRCCVEYPEMHNALDAAKYLVSAVIPRLISACKENDWSLDPKDNYYNDLMIGIGNRLFSIGTGKFALAEFKDPWHCIGDGASAAYGAIDMLKQLEMEGPYSSTGVREMSPERIMVCALKAAARRNWSCNDDVYITSNFV